MAIFNVTHVNDYMRIASAGDHCVICAKKACAADKSLDAYSAQRQLQGKIENKKVVIVRTSGVDQCICMDCIKDIYDEHIAPTLPVEAEGDKE